MERQGVYKYQANADFKRGLRNKVVETRRKDKRRETMMRNRRMPLEEKTESNVPPQKETVAKEPAVAAPKGTNRLQKLREWQEKRKCLKEQEKKRQTKPFYAGASNAICAAKAANTVTSKPLTRLQMKTAIKAFSTVQNQLSKTKPTGTVTKKQKDTVKERNPPVIKDRNSPTSKPPPPEQKKSKTPQTKKAQPNKDNSKERTYQTKNIQQNSKENSKEKPVSEQQNDEAWISTAKKPKKAVTGVDFEKAFQSDKTLSPFRFGGEKVIQSPKFTFNMKATVGSSTTFVTKLRGCPPSPLCFHYRAAEDLMKTPQQEMSEEVLPMDSLATVKRNAFHDPNSVNCNDISVPLQPSRVVHDSESGNVRDSGSSSSDGDDSGSEDKGNQADNKDTKTEDEKQVVSEDSSAMLVSGVAGAMPKSQEVQRFKDLHSMTVDRLTELCVIWEKKIDELNSTASSDNEEVLGQIRAAIGQAQLLVNKKLKQFLGLCHSAEDDSAERKTTPDDLQGFWDMVSCQVDNVNLKFVQLEELEKNGWMVQEIVPKKRPVKKVRAAVASKRKAETVMSEEQKQRLAEQREKRAAARNRLKEMKAAVKKDSTKPMQEDDGMHNTEDSVFDEIVSSVAVLEVTTPKKKKIDDACSVVTHVRRSTRKTPNKYRRRSTVSRSSCSEEEPLVVKQNTALQNTNLIYFDSPSEKHQHSILSSQDPSGYDFRQFTIPPSPSKTGCLQPVKCSWMSDDSLGHASSHDTPSS